MKFSEEEREVKSVAKIDCVLMAAEITNPSVIPPREGQIAQRKRKISGKNMESAIHLKENKERNTGPRRVGGTCEYWHQVRRRNGGILISG